MYQGPASPTIQRQSQEEDRQRTYPGNSRSHPPPYSPSPNRPPSPRLYNGSGTANTMTLPPYPNSQPGHSPSPQMNGTAHYGAPPHAPSPSPSTRYDPLADHRDLNGSRKRTLSQTSSPVQARTSLTPYTSHPPDMSPSPQSYRSPTQPNFPQHSPVPRHASTILAPEPFTKPYVNAPATSTELNGHVVEAPSRGTADEGLLKKHPPIDATPAAAEPKKPDPMSFSNILSGDVVEPPRPSTRGTTNTAPIKKERSELNGENHVPAPASRKPAAKATPPQVIPAKSSHVSTGPPTAPMPTKTTAGNKRKPLSSTRENEKVLKEIAKLDAMELSDIENLEFDRVRDGHFQFTQAREQALFKAEQSKRKRRRTAAARNFSLQIGAFADQGKERFWTRFEPQALEQVQQKEHLDEKERKKDMQRKRRRERALQQQEQALEEAEEGMRMAADDAEREKFFQQAQRAEKKAKNTKRILEGRDESPEGIREVTPMALNMEGGTMGTFQTAVSPEPPRKKPRTGGSSRPKKSKEKKDQEKAQAEAGFAAGYHMLGSNDHVNIAPKEGSYDYVRETRQSQAMKDASPSSHATTNFNSKGYQQMFEQIWKDIAKKDIPKVYRIKESSLATKQSNLRKTVQLASKEARRWQLRTNKGTKDVQARAKRSMREMMSFWKRNERAERDLRKNAEKQELELARKAEADRESNRQKRKLNFLIEQTELYAHFIGNKIKTDEVEKSTDPDVGTSTETVQPGKADAHTITLPTSSSKAGKVTGFDQLDFDAEDETALKEAAMANAQNAVEEAQARAKAFNSGGQDLQSQFDDGEMNFQNPTGMGDINIAQPKMLAAQLKEYQLKGLNWLVNLYEQGINGILADEMGLGKTVQSISVMGYLAEKYNIWGPFLVIAPASTLHNWQQEIARFLPGLKCLPYWGNGRDRKILRKFWDRKSITYNKDSPFHVLITSYQLVVLDTPYFQKMRWQYMILDEAQAIKSSNSSRWKCLLGFHCRNRLLLTGTPIQNNMQELWALLHFIMPSLFDSHDEFSEWFSKDIESHAQTNTKLNEDQLKRLHMILKPFMLRRVKKNVQKELGDKVEKDVFCDLTYRQRAYYTNLRNKISVMDLIEKAAVGDDQDTATLMNLVMQFRKVCNHPDLFERADITSPFSLVHFAETASFLREGPSINVDYSTKNTIDYDLPRLLCKEGARLDLAGPHNPKAGTKNRYLRELMNIWTPENISRASTEEGAFSWLRFADISAGEVYRASHSGLAHRALELASQRNRLAEMNILYDGDEGNVYSPAHALFNINEQSEREPLAEVSSGHLKSLLNISRKAFDDQGLSHIEKCAQPGANAPPIQISCSNQDSRVEKENVLFNVPLRKALYGLSELDEAALLEAQVPPEAFPRRNLLPEPLLQTARFTDIQVPSMRRFVTDSGKLAKLDELLRELKEEGHRVLLYFQMTRMIDLMEEYLTFRNYKYLRLDGSTKLEDRRDTVADFQTKPENFIFLLSTRAGGLGINLTAADTVIFYDSDWNPTIDSQAMDRAHRLGQTRQVTVYRMITRGTIEERIRKRALQKEEVQRVVISGQSGTGVDFNTRSKENRTKDIALWLADDEQAELIEKKEAEVAARGEEKRGRKKGTTKKKEISLDDMYHEGEGHFEHESSNKPSGAATPIDGGESTPGGKRKGVSKRAKTIKQRLAVADGSGA